RVCLLFARRAFNIESLVVSPAFDGKFSRMTITASGDRSTLEQIIKQCGKLVDVVNASEHNSSNCVVKEIALIKIKSDQKNRQEVLQILQHFNGQTLDLADKSIIIQVTGNSDKIDACLELVKKYEILELIRSGKLAMTRGLDET
ncbi:acetolactate synthase small subunit, partial [Candidatus Marinamargulisbacteria bacterium SCGC AAA071-K20]